MVIHGVADERSVPDADASQCIKARIPEGIGRVSDGRVSVCGYNQVVLTLTTATPSS